MVTDNKSDPLDDDANADPDAARAEDTQPVSDHRRGEDEIVFGDMQHRLPTKRQRPDRDPRFIALAVGIPQPGELPVFLSRYAADGMERHALADTSVELGGILLGKECLDLQTEEPFVVISQFLPARHYENTQASFTYTHDSWEAITRERETYFPLLDIVGWYHTHPDFGIFLSGHDLFLHRNFFPHPLQVAYVIDPIRQTRGFFQWRQDAIHELTGFFLWDRRGQQPALARIALELDTVGRPAIYGARPWNILPLPRIPTSQAQDKNRRITRKDDPKRGKTHSQSQAQAHDELDDDDHGLDAHAGLPRTAQLHITNHPQSHPTPSSGEDALPPRVTEGLGWPGGFSPRLEAELIRMLSQRYAQPAASANSAGVAFLTALLGFLLTLVLLILGLWIYQTQNALAEQTLLLKELKTSRADNEQKLAPTLALELLSRSVEGKIPADILSREATKIREERDSLRKEQTLWSEITLRKEKELLALAQKNALLTENVQKHENELDKLKAGREEVAGLKERLAELESLTKEQTKELESYDDQPKGVYYKRYQIAWWTSVILGVLCLGITWVWLQPFGQSDGSDPNAMPPFPQPTPPNASSAKHGQSQNPGQGRGQSQSQNRGQTPGRSGAEPHGASAAAQGSESPSSPTHPNPRAEETAVEGGTASSDMYIS